MSTTKRKPVPFSNYRFNYFVALVQYKEKEHNNNNNKSIGLSFFVYSTTPFRFFDCACNLAAGFVFRRYCPILCQVL